MRADVPRVANEESRGVRPVIDPRAPAVVRAVVVVRRVVVRRAVTNTKIEAAGREADAHRESGVVAGIVRGVVARAVLVRIVRGSCRVVALQWLVGLRGVSTESRRAAPE